MSYSCCAISYLSGPRIEESQSTSTPRSGAMNQVPDPNPGDTGFTPLRRRMQRPASACSYTWLLMAPAVTAMCRNRACRIWVFSSIYLSIYLLGSLFVRLTACFNPSICLSSRLSAIYPSIYVSIYQSIHPSAYLSLYTYAICTHLIYLAYLYPAVHLSSSLPVSVYLSFHVYIFSYVSILFHLVVRLSIVVYVCVCCVSMSMYPSSAYFWSFRICLLSICPSLSMYMYTCLVVFIYRPILLYLCLSI